MFGNLFCAMIQTRFRKQKLRKENKKKELPALDVSKLPPHMGIKES